MTSERWLGHELKIEGTFLPHTGDDFWLGLDEELSAGWGCNMGIDGLPPLPLIGIVLTLPPVVLETEELVGEPATKGDGAEVDRGLPPKDIWVWPCGALPCCWGRFLIAEVVDAAKDGTGTWEAAGVLAEFFQSED